MGSLLITFDTMKEEPFWYASYSYWMLGECGIASVQGILASLIYRYGLQKPTRSSSRPS